MVINLFVKYPLYTYSLIFGLLVGLIINLIIPSVVNKYQVQTSVTISGYNYIHNCFFNDTSSSSSSCINLLLDKNTNVNGLSHVWEENHSTIYSQRLLGRLISYPKPKCFDIDADGKNEFFYISAQNDTLFLFIHDVSTQSIKRKVPVMVHFKSDQMLNSKICYLGSVQAEKNRLGKFYFVVERNRIHVYCYDYVSNKLTENILPSDQTHINDGGVLKQPGANACIFLYSNHSNKNIRMVNFFDLKLNELFSDSISSEQLLYLCENNDLLVYRRSINKTINKLQLKSSLIQKKLVFENYTLPDDIRVKVINNDFRNIIYFTSSDEREESLIFSMSLEDMSTDIITVENIEKFGRIHYAGDINEDGITDIVTTSVKRGQEAIVVSEGHNGRNAVIIPISRESLYIYNVVKKAKGKILVQMYDKTMTIEYTRNPDYVSRWFWRSLIVVSSIFMVFFIQLFTIKRQEKIFFFKNKMIELQLRNIRDRIDPHFVFNTINSSSSFLLCGDRMEAYDYLSKLSGLLRYSLNNADKLMIPLKDEVENCQHYLDIQRMRFNNKFDYSFKVDEDISREVEVPSGVLVNLSENAIKHGFNGIDQGGLIKLFIGNESGGLLFRVEDNGIGRAEAAKRSNSYTSTGTGSNVINQYVAILNSKNKRKVKFTIHDLLNDNGEPIGTLCEFFLPNNLTY